MKDGSFDMRNSSIFSIFDMIMGELQRTSRQDKETLLNLSCVVVHGRIEITIWAAVDGESGTSMNKKP